MAIVDGPWSIVVGGGFAFPETTGEKPRGTDFFNRHMDRLVRRAHTDGMLRELYPGVPDGATTGVTASFARCVAGPPPELGCGRHDFTPPPDAANDRDTVVGSIGPAGFQKKIWCVLPIVRPPVDGRRGVLAR